MGEHGSTAASAVDLTTTQIPRAPVMACVEVPRKLKLRVTSSAVGVSILIPINLLLQQPYTFILLIHKSHEHVKSFDEFSIQHKALHLLVTSLAAGVDILTSIYKWRQVDQSEGGRLRVEMLSVMGVRSSPLRCDHWAGQ